VSSPIIKKKKSSKQFVMFLVLPKKKKKSRIGSRHGLQDLGSMTPFKSQHVGLTF